MFLSVGPEDWLATVRAIESHSARAWPARHITQHSGWELRLSPALASRRVNSLNAVAPDPGRFSDVLAEAASVCRRQGLPCHVRMLPLAGKAAFDHLRTLGLRGEGETTVEILPLRVHFPSDLRARISPTQTDEWLDTYLAAEHHADGEREEIACALNAVASPQAFVVAYDHGKAVAVGRGVVADGRLGIFQIATLPEARRRGFARAIVTALLNWAIGLSAEDAYLQVVSTNKAARALYEGIGFKPLYTYDYWTVPTS